MAENRWYPSRDQIDKPEQLERTLRRILQLHYDTVDKAAATSATPMGSKASQVPQQGGSNTQMLGLPVIPVDPNTLADGATLKYVKATRSFKFS